MSEIESNAPPLPPLPAEEPPPPPPPPPSTQTSNQVTDWLDFDTDVGGPKSTECEPPAKRPKMDEAQEGTEEEGEIVEDSQIKQEMNKNTTNVLLNAITSLQTPEYQYDSLEEGEIQDRSKVKASSIPECMEVAQSPEKKEEPTNISMNTVLANGNVDVSSDNEDVMSYLKGIGRQEFEIIDDLGSDDEGHPYDSDDLDEDEIDAMLEEGVVYTKGQKGGNEGDFAAPIEREKVVLKERGQDPFDILPEGWVTVTHNSGMPVYLHKQSRVCTLSRPYFLGPGSARKHDIPLSGIPCLQYRQELEGELLEGNRDGEDTQGETTEQPLVNGNASSVPQSDNDQSATSSQNGSQSGERTQDENQANGTTSGSIDGNVKVESVEIYKKEKTLGPLEIRSYCKKLFEFQTITVKRYKTWKDRRKHHKMMKINSRPSLPSNTKLITCPVVVSRQEEKPNRKKEFVLNPAGKSEICILHEYVQHAMRVQPKYIFKELENAQTPYSATVVINNVEYGTGYASSKKAAKNEAAKGTLGILIPCLKKVTDESTKSDIHDLSFFDEVKIEDPRVHDLCNKAGQPSPYQILCECLRRNFGMGDTQCQMDMRTLKHQKSEFTMKVSKHTATVICKNKREGKQLAAQAILQRLHPHIHSWGSLLRLYGTDWKLIKEKEEELSVTALHAKARLHEPNYAILNKLQTEMKKLQMRRVDSSMLLEALDMDTPGATLLALIQEYLEGPLMLQALKYSLWRLHCDHEDVKPEDITDHQNEEFERKNMDTLMEVKDEEIKRDIKDERDEKQQKTNTEEEEDKEEKIESEKGDKEMKKENMGTQEETTVKDVGTDEDPKKVKVEYVTAVKVKYERESDVTNATTSDKIEEDTIDGSGDDRLRETLEVKEGEHKIMSDVKHLNVCDTNENMTESKKDQMDVAVQVGSHDIICNKEHNVNKGSSSTELGEESVKIGCNGTFPDKEHDMNRGSSPKDLMDEAVQVGLGEIDLFGIIAKETVQVMDKTTQIDMAVECGPKPGEDEHKVDFIGPRVTLDLLTRYHVATQTDWTGQRLFHKAVQFPDVLYSNDQRPPSAILNTVLSTPTTSSHNMMANPCYSLMPTMVAMHPHQGARYRSSGAFSSRGSVAIGHGIDAAAVSTTCSSYRQADMMESANLEITRPVQTASPVTAHLNKIRDQIKSELSSGRAVQDKSSPVSGRKRALGPGLYDDDMMVSCGFPQQASSTSTPHTRSEQSPSSTTVSYPQPTATLSSSYTTASVPPASSGDVYGQYMTQAQQYQAWGPMYSPQMYPSMYQQQYWPWK